MIGTVTKSLVARGFGFIRAEGTRDEHFFHVNAVDRRQLARLAVGDDVEFSVTRDPRWQYPPCIVST
jgi:cold shock CspA family protein